MRNSVLSAQIGGNHNGKTTPRFALSERRLGLNGDIEYHKGEFCAHKPVWCQEGYCSQCAIYVETHPSGQGRTTVAAKSSAEPREVAATGGHRLKPA